MFSLMLYEFKKIFKDIKNIACIGFFIIFIVGIVFINEKVEARKINSWGDELQLNYDNVRASIEEINKEIKENGGGIATSTQKQKVKFLTEYEILISNLIEKYKNKDLQEYLLAEKAIELHCIKGVNKGIKFSNEKFKEEYEYNIEKLDFLISKNIVPIFEDNCMQGYNFLRICSSDIIIIVLVMVMLNLVVECFSSEVEKGTYKLLYIQPVSKTKIFFSKFIVRFMVSTVVLGMVIVVTFMILGLKNGFGNLEYPTKMYIDGKIAFVPLKEFLNISIPLLVLVLIFMFCFFIFISCIINSTSTAGLLSILIPVSCLCMCTLIVPIKPFLPFSYIAVNDFLNSSQYGLMNGNLSGATILISGTSICLVIGALYALNKKIYKK